MSYPLMYDEKIIWLYLLSEYIISYDNPSTEILKV